MLKLILLFQLLGTYPYERVIFSPVALVSEKPFLYRDYFDTSVFSGIVFYPAEIKAFSLGMNYRFFQFGAGWLSTGKVRSYDEFGQERGDYTVGVFKGDAGVDLASDFVNIRATISGVRVVSPGWSESKAWVNLDFYRKLIAFENFSIGATLSYESSLSFYLFGPYHFIGGDYCGKNNYELRAAFYQSFRFASFLLGFAYIRGNEERIFKPFFSMKVRYKNLGFYYFYKVEREISDLVGISVCYN